MRIGLFFSMDSICLLLTSDNLQIKIDGDL